MNQLPPASLSIRTPPAALRYAVAFVLIVYGFAKLMGSQFTVLDSELDRPMREVSGFWLTWYYFGYSPIYGNLIGLLQICGALLLTFRRSTLLGACVLFGIVTNIVLVDIFYGIDFGATVVALLLWGALLVILSAYRNALLALFWRREEPGSTKRSDRRGLAAWAARVGMVVFAAGLTYWAANYNNRDPTPLDGTWQVTAASGFEPVAAPSRIYFEHNRAYMVVFRYPDSTATHHFEVDPRRRSIGIWNTWLRKDARLFTGTYVLAGNRARLAGRYAGAPRPVALDLLRVSNR